jgi:hypothetical protein
MTKRTYGQKIIDHNAQNLTLDDDVIEYRKQIEHKLLADLSDVTNQALINPIYKDKDFYIVTLMKVERIGQAPRTFTLARQSCPTPVYKQSVWKYSRLSGNLQFLWSIPDAILYHHILKNQQKYLADKECADLAKFVILMESGELLTWIKQENGEKADALIINAKENVC